MVLVSAQPTDQIDPELVAASIPDDTGAMWVTPELAILWLQRNDNNRNVRQALVNTIARDMACGHWAFTGEAIKFSKTGRLVDGQHRLLGIVKSGETVKMLVVTGLDDDSQAFMDAGARRTAADALNFKGEANTTALASTVRFAITIERKVTKHKTPISTAEVIQWLTHHPDIRRYVGKASRYSKRNDFKPSIMAYALWRLYALDEDEAEIFFTDIIEMRSGGLGDPVYTLLQRMRSAKRNREIIPSVVEMGFIFRAWNARRAGFPLKVLKIPANLDEIIVPR